MEVRIVDGRLAKALRGRQQALIEQLKASCDGERRRLRCASLHHRRSAPDLAYVIVKTVRACSLP
jgi:hypothetical protein